MPGEKYTVLMVNGPNLGYIGRRDPGTYGTRGMDAVQTILEKDRPGLLDRIELNYFQANGEGEIIDRLEKAWKDNVQGLVINPGAYTHTSLALGDCLAWINIPHVEVHLSNIWSREEIRRQNLTAAHSLGVIAGFGIMSYVLGLEALVWYLDSL
ncbi:3-dehydroquinate dehydratase [Desulfonatronospira thiodismutans ASO3-1]|uniref:3-dehydroquinate dehydratase n=1 Tax=Desulfonatronospira thiodismutans ASO3-1 TaxID=555779 RepID=D6SQ25_9BACT|nr:type II 3-dehydroquinate dehydratase [Desulfonatronospira thiodismutans]EFI34851.1 3-dehydroquinate dehydratase [Desulfonatronospira thiodismutans ASO3-1]